MPQYTLIANADRLVLNWAPSGRIINGGLEVPVTKIMSILGDLFSGCIAVSKESALYENELTNKLETVKDPS